MILVVGVLLVVASAIVFRRQGRRAVETPAELGASGGAEGAPPLETLALTELSRARRRAERPLSVLISALNSRRRRLVRRGVDLVVLLLVAPVAATLVAALAVLVKLDSPGPAFVTHRRIGAGGREFRLFKVRTMVRNAEEMKAQLMDLNVLPLPDFKVPNDPRVTRVGRWLRKTSLDELPQLWNVLRGEMTLVGPRPCSIEVSRYELWQTERLEVTPGLIGRWQAEGRNRVDFAGRCRMDIRQLRDDSSATNLTLAAKTVRTVLTSRESF